MDAADRLDVRRPPVDLFHLSRHAANFDRLADLERTLHQEHEARKEVAQRLLQRQPDDDRRDAEGREGALDLPSPDERVDHRQADGDEQQPQIRSRNSLGTLRCQLPGCADSNTTLLMTPMMAMIATAQHSDSVSRTREPVDGRSATHRKNSTTATSGTTHVRTNRTDAATGRPARASANPQLVQHDQQQRESRPRARARIATAPERDSAARSCGRLVENREQLDRAHAAHIGAGRRPEADQLAHALVDRPRHEDRRSAVRLDPSAPPSPCRPRGRR